jgi:hypothetical protein
LSAIKFASEEGLTEEEYSSIPEAVLSHITENATAKSKSKASVKGTAKKSLFQETIPYGQRNDTLFRRACYYRSLGWEEQEIFERISVDNQTSCEPDPEGNLLSAEEIRAIAQSACKQEKGTPPAPKILAAVEVVENYYRENPPKGMAEHTDRDITEAFLEKALRHGSVVPGGIELSISYGCLAEAAGVGDSTLRKALNERLIKNGHFKRGKEPKGLKSGTLILIPSKFYATSAHSTNIGLSAPSVHKTQGEDFRSRWGKRKFGKARNHLLRAIEEAVESIEGEITPKKITEFLNQGVTDSGKLVKSTSISRHLAKMCEAGVLEKVRHGVYRLHPDRYRNLALHMLISGEYDSISRQRVNRKKRREEYREFLGIEEGELGDDLEITPEMMDEINAWNKDQDWEEVRPFVEADRRRSAF